MFQSSLTIGFYIIALLLMTYVFVFIPCLHLTLVIKDKVSTVEYETRRKNVDHTLDQTPA